MPQTSSARWALVAMTTVGLAGCGQRAPRSSPPNEPAEPPVQPAEPPIEVVVAPRADVTVGDAELERIRQRPEVVSVIPRMRLRGPARGTMTLAGQEISVEVGDFTDGIPTRAIDPGLADRFVDPAPGGDQPVPVVVSPTLVTLYNDQVAGPRGLPHLSEADIAAASRGDRLTFTIELGASMVAPEPAPPSPRSTVRARVVGVSPRATPIGMTVPIGQVAAWNRQLLGDQLDVSYDSVTVLVRGASRRQPFAVWLDRELALTLAEP